MIDLFSEEMRRNPFPLYDLMRSASPVLHVPPPFDHWMIFDYEGVKRALRDQDTFSSAVPGPKDWFIFLDPPRHTKLRALISRAFIPCVVTNLEPRIRELSRELLDPCIKRGGMDLAVDYAVPLPMRVIAHLIGIPQSDWAQFRRWSDMILELSHTLRGMDPDKAIKAHGDFVAAATQMSGYLKDMIAHRRRSPQDDMLTRLIEAEVDGQRLTHDEILGFFELLVVGGQETTANLINNAVLCLLENPHQLLRLRQDMALLPSAIEETLRYRSPIQWLMRTPRDDVQMQRQTIPRGKLVLAVVGSANRDPQMFENPAAFDITRHPNPHLAFGNGLHFCLGAPLARAEARIALTDILQRLPGLERADNAPWEPRLALHVHGPSRLPIRFRTGDSASLERA